VAPVVSAVAPEVTPAAATFQANWPRPAVVCLSVINPKPLRPALNVITDAVAPVEAAVPETNCPVMSTKMVCELEALILTVAPVVVVFVAITALKSSRVCQPFETADGSLVSLVIPLKIASRFISSAVPGELYSVIKFSYFGIFFKAIAPCMPFPTTET